MSAHKQGGYGTIETKQRNESMGLVPNAAESAREGSMEETLSIEEIRSRYAGEWLLISYAELDEQMNTVSGQVLAHSPNRDEIYRQLLFAKGKSVAVDYAGTVPEDLAVVL